MEKEKEDTGKDIMIVISTILSYFLLKYVFDWLSERGISKKNLLVGILIVSYVLFFLNLLIKFIFDIK